MSLDKPRIETLYLEILFGKEKKDSILKPLTAKDNNDWDILVKEIAEIKAMGGSFDIPNEVPYSEPVFVAKYNSNHGANGRFGAGSGGGGQRVDGGEAMFRNRQMHLDSISSELDTVTEPMVESEVREARIQIAGAGMAKTQEASATHLISAGTILSSGARKVTSVRTPTAIKLRDISKTAQRLADALRAP